MENVATPLTARVTIPWWAWCSLLAGILVSVLAAWIVKMDTQASSEREFEFACNEIRQNIQARLAANAQVLHSGVALFSTADTVTRSDWRTFTQNLRIDDFLPGTQGVGYAVLLRPEKLEGHTKAIRAEGFPDYAPHPPGLRDQYSSIIYLEPFSGRNLRAFGYDMLSEPVRRQALEKARDENRPILSGKVTLVQETSKDIQAGTLMFVPVYRRKMAIETVDQRRTALIGWVYSPYRMNDLMQGTLRGWDVKRKNHPIVLEVYDGDSLSKNSLLYHSRAWGDSSSGTIVDLERITSIDFAQRHWTLRILQLGNAHPWHEYRSAWMVLGGGLIISILLLGLMGALANTRSSAQAIADRSTWQLRELTDRLSLATRAGGVGIWDYDIVNNRLHWDEQMFRLYGISPERFGGAYEAWKSGVHPDDRQRSDAEIQLAIQGEKEFDTEFRVVWPDGTVRCIRAISLVQRDASGRPVHMIGTNWDISQEKSAQESFRQSEKQISQLLQTTDQGIYGIDPKGKCTFINRSGLHLLGYQLEECLGQTMHSLIHHSHPDGSSYAPESCPIYLSKLEGIDCRLDTEVFWRKDGSSFPVEYSSHPVIVDGIIEGAVVTFSDITERKLAESALLTTNAELQEATLRANEMAVRAEMANAAKSEFLANMSHEIRTPMNGVLGMTGLLLDTRLDKEQRRFAEVIRQSADALLSLINDILDFSKIEAGKMELEEIEFDLAEQIEDMTAALVPKIQDKGLEFFCELSPSLPRSLRGDPGRLRQILLNLLSNAIKFTREGRIAVRAELESESSQVATLRFRVQDTGIGIPEEKQNGLFQKFTQVDASTTRQFGGTGLGLAISKQLAELMGGRIGLNSQAGIGTEFWFTVQLTKVNAPAETRHAKTGFVQLRGLRKGVVRILLADDNITNQLVAVGILEKLGLRTDAVANGQEVLHALERLPYDLVFMDVQMPELDGFATTRRIRDREGAVRNHDIPVIAMTANAMQGDRERCLAAGMNDYISKPVSPQAIADALGKWLPESAWIPDPFPDSSPAPTKVPDPTHPILDWNGLVRRMMGVEQLAKSVLNSARKQTPGQVDLLVSALESGDLSETKRLAHAIKGAVSNIGGEEFQRILITLESTAESGDAVASRLSADPVRMAWKRLAEEIDRII